ncbi:FAD-dependent oxidoreductase [Nocardioides sp. SYSU DS0663]|uniref:FAD-dependent oxidoreductase n=1 Tax=Nocardioides sp. SYSU DS0663 TaxID=3416445 RepID=UPI003F4BD474
MLRPLRVAVVGAGPAGIYAADLLTTTGRDAGREVSVDVLERDPTPYGLIRYGVAPDHPRIKDIVKALRRVLSRDEIAFFGNVEVGRDVKVEELHELYDAVVVATGAVRDRDLEVPGVELEGSFGGADLVRWYNGHPDAPRDWPFDPAATSVAVLGVGNVALDVARVLAKSADELLTTEIPPNVHAGLSRNATTDVHVFARRGPAQVKFSPMELRELSHSPSIDVVVHPEGFEFDEASLELLRSTKSVKLAVDVLTTYAAREPGEAPHRVHLHFCQDPVEILGEDGRVVGLRTAVTELDGTGRARRTGETVDWPVGAVYRAIGYRSDALPGIPFDETLAVVPNDGGRVLDLDGEPVPGLYVTGWVKRGPVGLIGHTKSDAAQTVGMLLADTAGVDGPARPHSAEVLAQLRDRGLDVTTWAEWERLDAAEVALGEAEGRARIKVVDRAEMIALGRSEG